MRTASVAPGDPAVTAVDFAFHPGTVTVSAGATITWTNSGAQPHTATANGGSFDTGILKTGQSASHTFTQPGTFSYFCTVHPFMKGTIVVLPAAGRTPVHAAPTTTSAPAATAASPGPARPAAGATTAASPSSAPTLPLTGMPVLSGVLIGLLLILLGSAVRRAARAG